MPRGSKQSDSDREADAAASAVVVDEAEGDGVDALRLLIWADGASSRLIERVVGAVGRSVEGLRVIGVAGEQRSVATDLAGSLGTEAVDDLRVRLVEERPDWLLLGTVDGLKRDSLEAAKQVGCRVISLEPIPPEHHSLFAKTRAGQADHGGDDDEMGEDGSPGEAVEGAIFSPRIRASGVWASADDPLGALGSVRAGSVVCLAPQESGSLLSRLYDGFDLVVAAFGLPETVDASLSGALANPPEELRGLTGHVTAHVRFTDGASVTLVASDRAARWTRRVSLLGSGAHLELDDARYRLLGADGVDVEREDAAGKVKKRRVRKTYKDVAIDPADLIAEQWVREISGMGSGVPAVRRCDEPESDHQLFACCQAALLSCKTAEPESPGRLLEISSA